MKDESVLRRHSASAPAAGYDFQFQRALLELINAKNGDVVGIETLDDVAIVGVDGTKILEQDKFTTDDTGKVYGDKTHNLLNTLSTWLTAALKGELDCAKTKFRLVTNVKCALGLVQKITDCGTRAEAQRIIEQIRGLESESKDYLSMIEVLNEPRAETLFCEICTSTMLMEEQCDIAQEVQEALPIENVYSSNRQHIYKALLGWLHDSAYSAWQKRIPFLVTKQSYVNELGAIKSRLERSTKRERPPSEIPVTQAEIDELSEQIFVRQIKLVSDDMDESYEARADYLRCITEKSRLSEEGEIVRQDWLDFNDGLRDRWKQIFRQKKRLRPPGRLERDVGYDIMNTTLNGQDEVKLAGSSITYPYLSKGSYHRLSDALDVGWHPNFKDLLKDDDHA